MNLNDYQRDAMKTAVYQRPFATIDNLAYAVLGLAGESGELANKLKKVLRDDAGEVTDERRAAMVAELGDVLWYVSAVAMELRVSLDEVAKAGLEKLATRNAKGTIRGEGDAR